MMSVVIGASLLTGCTSTAKQVSESQSNTETTVVTTSETMMQANFSSEDEYTNWQNGTVTTVTLDDTGIQVEGLGASAKEQVLTITSGGTYVLNGTLSNGQIIIQSNDTNVVRLVLNGVDITCKESAPLYVESAEKVVVSLEEGTTNRFTDGQTYTANTEEPDSAIFSKDDLTFNGTGTLEVQANYQNGITSKDDLRIMEGTFIVNAVNHGIKGKDMVAIKNGVFQVTAGGDAIKSTEDTEQTKGFVNIEEGTFTLTAGQDGIQGENNVQILGGTYEITTNGGSENGETHTQEMGMGGMMRPEGMTRPSDKGAFAPEGEGMTPPANEGTVTPEDEGMTPPTNEGTGVPEGDAMKPKTQAETTPIDESTTTSDPSSTQGAETTSEDTSTSYKGIKATNNIIITNGTINLDTADDSIHSNNNIEISGGDIKVASGDDGIHADNLLMITDGQIEVAKSYEGLEGLSVVISGGAIQVVASDDGINVAGGNDNASLSRPGANNFSQTTNSNAKLQIDGGTITVEANGDGLDANGAISINGGIVTVNGPTNGGNGALDYDTACEVTGGTLIAAGSMQMAQGVSESSTQPTLMMTFTQATQAAEEVVNVKDESGDVIVSCAPTKAYQSLVISSPELVQGKTYTLSYGASDTSIGSFTIESSITYLNESGVTTGMASQGMMMGHGGRRKQMNANEDGKTSTRNSTDRSTSTAN